MLRAVEKLVVGGDDGDGWDAFIYGDLVLLREVRVLFALADVDVDDDEVLINDRFNVEFVKPGVEDVAVVAPVSTEDQENALVLGFGSLESVGDFLLGIGIGRINGCVEAELGKSGGGKEKG